MSSGHVRQAVTAGVPNINPGDTTVNLTDDEIILLDATYAASHPRYSCLCRQYNESLHKAANAQRKSAFPCFAEWLPPGGYQDGDRELLQGPGLNRMATSHKRTIRECPNKGHKIVHSAASLESLHSRHSYSYVQIMKAEATPVFGHIQKLITHQFGSSMYEIAIVKEYNAAQKDCDCGFYGS